MNAALSNTLAPLIAVSTTVATQAQARQLASELLQQRLAACVQITVIESHYRWQGKLQQEPEYQLLIKTTGAQFPAIERWLQGHHPYQLPQLLATAIDNRSSRYEAWLREQLDS